MSGLLLDPRTGRPETRAPGLTLYVPQGYEDEDPYPLKCLVPGCGARFSIDHKPLWERHVGECARANLDALREISPVARQKGTVFDEDSWDPELAEHMRGVGERMQREGRMEVRPNERAGFS